MNSQKHPGEVTAEQIEQIKNGLYLSHCGLTTREAETLLFFIEQQDARIKSFAEQFRDADGDIPRLCNVCTSPVAYGERHTQCGRAVQELEAAIKQRDAKLAKQDIEISSGINQHRDVTARLANALHEIAALTAKCERLQEAVDWCLRNYARRGYDDSGKACIKDAIDDCVLDVPPKFSEIITTGEKQ